MNDDEILQVLTDTFYSLTPPLEEEITPDLRFAHYTSAAVAMSIIQAKPEDRCLWLRNATEMNDFSEVEFGQGCLERLLGDPECVNRLQEACDAIHPDLFLPTFTMMGEERRRIKSETYLLSLAVHDCDDTQGKLSMWRAYGGDANVCLVFNTAPFTAPQQAYDVYISSVSYEGYHGFMMLMEKLSDKLEDNRDQLRLLDPELLKMNMKFTLDAIVLSTKHPSFEEEQEWRVIYRPPAPPKAPDVPSRVVNVGGIVQTVYMLPMMNIPDKGVENAELHEILDKIIIGPTPNPPLVREAFVRLLTEAGIEDADKKVVQSNVPLRR